MFETENLPDFWVMLRVEFGQKDGGGFHQLRVLCGWVGGDTEGDAWKINSGVVGGEFDGEIYRFKGRSGSIYACHKNRYSMADFMHDGLKEMRNVLHVVAVEILEDQDWTQTQYPGPFH